MSKIISVGTAVPAYRHRQEDILSFMQHVYALNEVDKRRIRFLYHQSHIEQRYSVVGDYSRPISEWKFYPQSEALEPFPSLEERMRWYDRFAAPLSVNAIRDCLPAHIPSTSITHLITVSCTGMSAPGLDLQVMELLDLPKNIMRTSVNFMGCYAAIHALKLADAFCKSEPAARVMVVCTELCTLHFQKAPTQDNIASSLLFGDGAAAVLVMPDAASDEGVKISGFYSEVLIKGKRDMAWELSSSGFQMTLSGYIPDLIEEDFHGLTLRALDHYHLQSNAVTDWCVHPGGKRILEAITRSLALPSESLAASYDVLRDYGNMSSPTILFVLKSLMAAPHKTDRKIMGAAFGPGLTMETLLLTD